MKEKEIELQASAENIQPLKVLLEREGTFKRMAPLARRQRQLFF
jgi:hypothetical protein